MFDSTFSNVGKSVNRAVGSKEGDVAEHKSVASQLDALIGAGSEAVASGASIQRRRLIKDSLVALNQDSKAKGLQNALSHQKAENVEKFQAKVDALMDKLESRGKKPVDQPAPEPVDETPADPKAKKSRGSRHGHRSRGEGHRRHR